MVARNVQETFTSSLYLGHGFKLTIMVIQPNAAILTCVAMLEAINASDTLAYF